MLNRLERPDVRMAHVGTVCFEVNLAPLEGWQVIERRTTSRDELQLLNNA